MDQYSVVMVPTTACNLECRYCFEKQSPGKMSIDDVRLVFLRLRDFAEAEKVQVLSLFWQGGEIMVLGAEWMHACLEEAERIFGGSGVKILNSLQSNLMLYDDSWRDLIVGYFGSTVSTSLDYPNLFRGGAASFGDGHNQLWLQKYHQVKEDGISVGAITVLNNESIRVGPTLFLETMVEEFGLTNLQINLPFSTPDTRGPNYYLDAEAVGNFLAELFHHWHSPKSSWKDKIRLSPFDQILAAFDKNGAHSLPCIWGGDCFDRFISIGPDLDVAACDCWVTSLPDYLFGNLRRETLRTLLDGPVRKQLKKRNGAILEGECLDCEYLPLCFGGCPVRSLGTRGNPYDQDPYCGTYKKVFEAILHSSY